MLTIRRHRQLLRRRPERVPVFEVLDRRDVPAALGSFTGLGGGLGAGNPFFNTSPSYTPGAPVNGLFYGGLSRTLGGYGQFGPATFGPSLFGGSGPAPFLNGLNSTLGGFGSGLSLGGFRPGFANPILNGVGRTPNALSLLTPNFGLGSNVSGGLAAAPFNGGFISPFASQAGMNNLAGSGFIGTGTTTSGFGGGLAGGAGIGSGAFPGGLPTFSGNGLNGVGQTPFTAAVNPSFSAASGGLGTANPGLVATAGASSTGSFGTVGFGSGGASMGGFGAVGGAAVTGGTVGVGTSPSNLGTNPSLANSSPLGVGTPGSGLSAAGLTGSSSFPTAPTVPFNGARLTGFGATAM